MKVNKHHLSKMVLSIAFVVFSLSAFSSDLSPIDSNTSLFVIPPCKGSPGAPHSNGGGFVARTAKVDHTVYVGPNASVCDHAVVYDHVQIFGSAKVSHQAQVSDWVQIFGNAHVTAFSKLSDYVQVFGSVRIGGASQLCGSARIFENVHTANNAYICGDNIELSGNVQVLFYGRVLSNTKLSGNELVLLGKTK